MSAKTKRAPKGAIPPVPVVNPSTSPAKASIITEALPGDVLTEYSARISTAWREAYTSICEVGRILDEAKTRLGKRDWQRLIKDGGLPFSEATASKLMAISRDQRLSQCENLPASWGTLYELTTLTDEQFKAAQASCLIKAEMERKEVLALKAPQQPTSAPSSPQQPTPVPSTTTSRTTARPTAAKAGALAPAADPNIRNDEIIANFTAMVEAGLTAIDTLLTLSRPSLSRPKLDPVEIAGKYQGTIEDLEEASRWLQGLAVAVEARRASQARAA